MALTLLPSVASAEEESGDVYVGTTKVNTEEFKTKQDLYGGTVQCDNGVLILNGISISAQDNYTKRDNDFTTGIYSNNKLEIILEGENIIEGADNALESYGIFSTSSITLSGNGSLTAKGGDAERLSAGIYSEIYFTRSINNLNLKTIINISDEVSINAIGGNTTEYGGMSVGIYTDGDININGNVALFGGESSGNDSMSIGIYAKDDVNISDTTVKIDLSEAYDMFAILTRGITTITNSNIKSNGSIQSEEKMKIQDSSIKVVENKFGLLSNTLEIEDSEIEIIVELVGFGGVKKLTINNSDVKVKSTQIAGIVSPNIQISKNANVEAVGDFGIVPMVGMSLIRSGIEISDGAKLTAIGTTYGIMTGGSGSNYSEEGNSSSQIDGIVISDGTLIAQGDESAVLAYQIVIKDDYKWRTDKNTDFVLSTDMVFNYEDYDLINDDDEPLENPLNYLEILPIPKSFNATIHDGGVGASGEGEYTVGDIVNINAGTKTGHTFESWTTSGVSLSNPNNAVTNFVMPDNNVTLIANWTLNSNSNSSKGGGYYASNKLTITAMSSEGRTINLEEKTSVREGENIIIIFSPNEGYVIDEVLVNGKSVGAVSNYSLTNIQSNQTIQAVINSALICILPAAW